MQEPHWIKHSHGKDAGCKKNGDDGDTKLVWPSKAMADALDAEATKELLVNAFSTRRLVTAGPDFDAILPPMPLFGSADASAVAEENRRLAEFMVTEIYNRYRDDYAVETEES